MCEDIDKCENKSILFKFYGGKILVYKLFIVQVFIFDVYDYILKKIMID